MDLNQNPLLYAGLQQVIRRGSGIVLEETDTGIFLLDTVSQGFFLATPDVQTGIAWLKKHAALGYHLLSVFQRELVDFIGKEYCLSEILECYQAVYLPEQPPACRETLQIRCADRKEIPLILSHYQKLSPDELEQIVKNGNLYLAFRESEPVGFVGEHLEGSMGLLEVFPEYRRLGYGTELEVFMIRNMLHRKQIPFCQVETFNETSLRLQRKLGLSVSEEKVYWIF